MKRIFEAFQREKDMIVMEGKAIDAIWNDSPIDVPIEEKPYTVSSVCLYAATSKTIQPDNIYQMRGNEISV